MARMASTDPVEARSLGHLTALAANPPTYPRNPTQKPLDKVVLYIVRVPGSRDVFLSPLKPPTKSSVSAESLNASLYYLHVSSPQDEALLESIEQEKREKEQENRERNSVELPHLNRVQRKPVPGIAVTEEEEEEEEEEERPPRLPPRPPAEDLAPPPYSVAQPPELNYPGNGFGGGVQRDIPDQESWRPRLPPRPLPPLPNEQGNIGQVLPQRQDELDQSIRDTKRWSAQPSTSPRIGDSLSAPPVDFGHAAPGRASWDGGGRPFIRPGSRSPGDNDFDPFLRARPRGSQEYQTPHRSRRSYDKPRSLPQPATPFHITVIRRDPTHGHQWNVGTITNRGSGSEVADDGSMTIEITTPGYKKFAVDNQPLSLESLSMNLPDSIRDAASAPSTPRRPRTAETPQTQTGPTRFIRRVSLTYPPSARHRKQRSPQSSPERSPQRSKNGHYTFMSPWNGTCTFLTGVNGATLKCKHIMPPPLSLSSFSSPTNSQPPPPAVSVAEIRFNLPSFPFPPSGSSSSHGHSHSHSFGHSRNHSHSSSYGDFPASPSSPAEPGRLDLSLARERAGGGMRGKSAKLGKLIIEDEGLKMLDLVVAASMGVWWGVYDHVYG